MEFKSGCCQSCNAPCTGDFKKVVDLQCAGIAIYIFKSQDEQNAAKTEMNLILHNTRNYQLGHPDYINEIYKLKSQCDQCNSLLQTVRSLLHEKRNVKENEVIGLCQHCIHNQTSCSKTCKRCNFIANQFIEMHQKRRKEKQERFKVWLCRVRHLLQAILNAETACRVYRDPDLERILHSLRKPFATQELDVDLYPTRDPEKTMCLKRLAENREMLDELLTRIKLKDDEFYSSETNISQSSFKETCMCKALKERLLEGKYLGLGEQHSDLGSLLDQDMIKRVIQMLLDLSKALRKGLGLNKEIKLELMATLNSAINQRLAPNITQKLVKQLNDLTATMTHDLSKYDDYDVPAIQKIIKELNNLLFSRSKNVKQDLVKLLIDLTELLGDKLNKSLSKEMLETFKDRKLSPLSSKDKILRVPRDKVDKDVTQLEKIPKDRSLSPLSSKDKILGVPRDKVDKDVTQLEKIPKDRSLSPLSSKDKILGVPRDKVDKDVTQLEKFPKDRSLSPLSSKDKILGVQRDKVDKDVTQLEKIPKDRSLSPLSSKDKILGVPRDKVDKDVTQLEKIPKDRSLSPLSSKDKILGVPRDKVDKDVTQLEKNPKDRSLSPLSSKDKILGVQRDKVDKDITQTENAKDLPTKDLPTRDLPTKDLPTKDLPTKDLPTKDLPTKDLPTKSQTTLDLPKREQPTKDQGLTEIQRKEEEQGFPQDQSKTGTQKLKDSVSRDMAQDLLKSRGKDDDDFSKKLSKTAPIAQGLPSSGKDVQRQLSKTQRKDEVPKSQEKTQNEDSVVNKQLAQKMADLNKELKGDLNIEKIQKIANDIKKGLTQGSPDLNKDIIQELTDLCDPATKGLSSNVNIEKIQGLIKDVNKAVSQGLSNDQNMKEVKGHLQNLNKALGSKEDLSKDPYKSAEMSSKQESKATKVSKGVPKIEIDSPKDRNVSKPEKNITKDKQPSAPETKAVTKFQDTTSKDKGSKSKRDSITDKQSSVPKAKTVAKFEDAASKDKKETRSKKDSPSLENMAGQPKSKSAEGPTKHSKESKLRGNREDQVEKDTKQDKSLKGSETKSKKSLKEKENVIPTGETKKDAKQEKTLKETKTNRSLKEKENLIPTDEIRKDAKQDKTLKGTETKTKKSLKEKKDFIPTDEIKKDAKQDKTLKGTESKTKKSLKEQEDLLPTDETKKDAKQDKTLKGTETKTKKSLKEKKDLRPRNEAKILAKPDKTLKGTETKTKKSVKEKEDLLPTDETKKHAKQDKTSNGTETKTKKSLKEKEDLTPKDETKKDVTKPSKEKVKKLQKPKDVSESVFMKILTSINRNNEPDRMSKRQQLAKQREKEEKEKREREIRRMLELKRLQKSKKKLGKTKKKKTILTKSQTMYIPEVMIKGENIEPYDPHCKDDFFKPKHKPLIFHTRDLPGAGLLGSTQGIISEDVQKKEEEEDYFTNGVISYRLSDKNFIDKGWTTMPISKIMRKMNIYKMLPANPQNDWFERHKQNGQLTYETGEILADINNDGRGRWFYRNGSIALEYYDAQESNIGQRYVVYSSGENMENGKLKPRTILALFDFLGNGVVYDHNGEVRLKYNQSEGILVDSRLGPPGKWKWHTLNDPPDLQQVLVNVCLKEREPMLEAVSDVIRTDDSNYNIYKPSNSDMLAIELENFVKEKATKLVHKFKPFEIRMKAVKLNEYFALKVLDQAHIYLLFRDGVTSLKLNLGMVLISDEIIDVETADMVDVSTPYDKVPAKTDSLENIQKFLKSVRSSKQPN